MHVPTTEQILRNSERDQRSLTNETVDENDLRRVKPTAKYASVKFSWTRRVGNLISHKEIGQRYLFSFTRPKLEFDMMKGLFLSLLDHCCMMHYKSGVSYMTLAFPLILLSSLIRHSFEGHLFTIHRKHKAYYLLDVFIVNVSIPAQYACQPHTEAHDEKRQREGTCHTTPVPPSQPFNPLSSVI